MADPELLLHPLQKDGVGCGRGCSAGFNLNAGSALLLSLVFLSVLSTIALSALEAAWSGQRMTSAYINHQQTLLGVERELLIAEQSVWQHINTSGLDQSLLMSQDTENPQASTVIKTYQDWIETGFAHLQCGPLFEVFVSPADPSRSHASLSVRWDVCCENSEACMALEFTQQRRLWARATSGSSF